MPNSTDGQSGGSPYEPLVEVVVNELVDAHARQVLAEFMLGPKGEHFDGEEWERRADEWHGRARLAEARLAQEARLG